MENLPNYLANNTNWFNSWSRKRDVT